MEMTKFQRYKEIEAVNQSRLKSILSGYFKASSYGSDAMDLGSLVDCKITTPQEFDDQFYVVEEKPGPKPKQIVDHIFEAGQQLGSITDHYRDDLFILMDVYDYLSGTYKDSMDSRRAERLIKDSSNYYKELQQAGNRVIVSTKDVILSDKIARSIKQGRFTAVFHDLPFGIKVYNQVVITWQYNGVPCKALLDRVLENTTDEIIMLGRYLFPPKSIIIIDYKTMNGNVLNFPKAMKKYRYDLQASWYSFGGNQWIASNRPDLRLNDFFFIVESTTQIGSPLTYRLSDLDKRIGRWGGNNTYEGWIPAGSFTDDYDKIAQDLSYDVLGWEQALFLYQWHLENNEWEYSREAVLSDGIIETTQYL